MTSDDLHVEFRTRTPRRQVETSVVVPTDGAFRVEPLILKSDAHRPTVALSSPSATEPLSLVLSEDFDDLIITIDDGLLVASPRTRPEAAE